jgi:hypothetical protein
MIHTLSTTVRAAIAALVVLGALAAGAGTATAAPAKAVHRPAARPAGLSWDGLSWNTSTKPAGLEWG